MLCIARCSWARSQARRYSGLLAFQRPHHLFRSIFWIVQGTIHRQPSSTAYPFRLLWCEAETGGTFEGFLEQVLQTQDEALKVHAFG